MQNNVMIDLETFGTHPNAVIVAIGAVRFDRDGLSDEFLLNVDPASCERHGMALDAETVMWWLRQSQAARDELSQMQVSITTALEMFGEWLGDNPMVWGNGAGFDNVILGNAYRCCRMQQPWRYSNDRCYRTIKGLCPDVRHASNVSHRALDDARKQAAHLIECLRQLKRLDMIDAYRKPSGQPANA